MKRTKKVSTRVDKSCTRKVLEISPKTEAIAKALVTRAAEELLANESFKKLEKEIRENSIRLQLIESSLFELAKLMHTKGLIHLPDEVRSALEKQSGKRF